MTACVFRELPPHFRLMLAASRFRADSELLRQLADAKEDAVDWPAFLEVTKSQRVAPLVLSSLKKARPAGVPQAVYDALSSAVSRNALRVLTADATIQRIHRHFLNAGIELVLLKGLALAKMLYGSTAMRHNGDIDFLTLDRDLERQIELFAQLGFEVVNPVDRLTTRRLDRYRSYWKDLTVQHRQTGISVELHWRYFNHRFHPANRLLQGQAFVSAGLSEPQVRTLTRADTFLYLAAHGIADRWLFHKSLADVGNAFEQLTPEELDSALERATEIGLLEQVSSAIHLAGECMGFRVEHPSVLPASRPLHQQMRSMVMERWVRSSGRAQRTSASAGDALRFELSLVPGARSLGHIAGRYVWRPRVWSRFDLPDRLLWLHPIVGLLLPPRLEDERLD